MRDNVKEIEKVRGLDLKVEMERLPFDRERNTSAKDLDPPLLARSLASVSVPISRVQTP
jgi:hypothetical protein